jgi:pimeloyl-ACP methyl ester carboxylesterase
MIRGVPARLHHERIGTGRALLLTHGIYGSGGNWRAIARKLVERRPDWSVVLVDLRQHGRSEPGEPPHTIAACADDVRALIDELGDVGALAGHSFGGKVMLATRAIAPPAIRQIWALDSSPSAHPGAEHDPANTVTGVLEMMERLPRTWPTRDAFVAAAIAEGQTSTLAQWLAMNVVPAASGGFGLRLDLVALRAMLADYYVRDLWPVVLDPSLPGTVELVIADRSVVFGPADRARLPSLPPDVHIHHIDAGHWLNVEAPAAVLELLARDLAA